MLWSLSDTCDKSLFSLSLHDDDYDPLLRFAFNFRPTQPLV